MTQTNHRDSFLKFFKSKNHTIVPSDSLVPSSDPSLLFTSAGMVQFKAHFLQQISLTYTRAASSQRCLRTTDIDQVGLTPRHLTLFEMLGNFSFGDYFKEEAIAWAWEFFTKELNLPEKRLWVTIHTSDDEAEKIWKKIIPASKIKRLGDDTNFWTMGPTGPCGPCSEIYWDFNPDQPSDGPDDSNRWMEIWNLVFTQFDRQPDGTLIPLKKKNIDTGMGLERLASVVEGVSSNFETQYLKPLIQFGEETFKYKSGKDFRKDVALRIVADHIRAVTLLIYDGILPGNEGRGYVLRRLLRRAVRQGSLFGIKEPFLFKGVAHTTGVFNSTATDLMSRQNNIEQIVKEEEERFLETIETGSGKLSELIGSAKNKKTKNIPGIDVFRLYDTYGFPPELTKEILAEQNLSYNEEELSKARLAAQEKAREGWKGSGAIDTGVYNTILKKIGESKFRGYDTLETTSPISAILKEGKEVSELKSGEEGEVFTSETPFYPEGGGQVGDKGFIKLKNEIIADIIDAQKPIPNLISHIVRAKTSIKLKDISQFSVDPNHREPTKRHHTATHLLHAALRKILGTGVTQAGSLVAPDRLRFDYTYNKPLSKSQIQEIEDMVNEAILRNWKVEPQIKSADEARKLGAMALFGEKYGDQVRCLVVSPKGFDSVSEAFSLELCGGTHVSASGDIGAFKITSDSSLAAGVRRMEAIAGHRAIQYMRSLEDTLNSASEKLKIRPNELADRVNKLMDRQRQLEQEIRDLKLKMAQGGTHSSQEEKPQTINGIPVVMTFHQSLNVQELRTLADRLKTKAESGLVIVGSSNEDEGKVKISFVVTLTKDLLDQGWHAGKLAKAMAADMGGSGGGRPDFAQGGGQGQEKIDLLKKNLPQLIKK